MAEGREGGMVEGGRERGMVEGGRKGGREEWWREGGREGGREGERDGGGKEGGREGWHAWDTLSSCTIRIVKSLEPAARREWVWSTERKVMGEVKRRRRPSGVPW